MFEIEHYSNMPKLMIRELSKKDLWAHSNCRKAKIIVYAEMLFYYYKFNPQKKLYFTE